MCTVTYLPLENSDFILTSSRDVPFSRKKADLPKRFIEDNVELWYPKDGNAGGTWIGTSSKKRLICLLNGGHKYHTSRAKYKHSRGLIVKELLKIDDIKVGLKKIDLHNIEQFTLTIVDWNHSLKLIEFVWDGKNKHFREMLQKPHIWSSSTLYDESVKKLREDWFANWQSKNEFTQNNILEFHQNAGVGDKHIDVMMNRGLGGTVSITSIKKQNGKINFSYEDIQDNSNKRTLLDYKCHK